MKTGTRALVALATGICAMVAMGTSASAATFNSPTGAGAGGDSDLLASGLTGTVASVEVRLTGITHQGDGRELDIVLRAPGGKQSVLMSDACQGPLPGGGITLTFSDAALQPVPSGACNGLSGQKVQPEDYFEVNDDFPGVPAKMSAFNGIDPNGIWKVSVTDDTLNAQTGGFGPWRLTVQTTPPPTDPGTAPAITPGTAPAVTQGTTPGVTAKRCKKKRTRSAEAAKRKKCKKKKRR
jgi:hypothetical protein